jgi:hypothetical protein
VLRPLLIVGAMVAAVGIGLVYASWTPSHADASRFWVNSMTAETTSAQ